MRAVEVEVDHAVALAEVGLEDLACLHAPLEGQLGCLALHVGEPHRDLEREPALVAIEMHVGVGQPGFRGVRGVDRRRVRQCIGRHRNRLARRRDPPFDVRLRDPPLRHQPVGRRALVQHAGRLAVHVPVVLLGDHAQLGEIQMGVHRLQRIVGPLDELVALCQRLVALRQLQRPAEPAVAVLRQHAEHVRPLQHLATGLHADDRVDETDHAVPLVVGTDQDRAALHGDREHR